MGAAILMASLALTPRGRLLFTVADGTFQPPEALLRRLESAFGRGSGHGLLDLGAAEVGTALPADFGYWRDFGAPRARAQRARRTRGGCAADDRRRVPHGCGSRSALD